MRSFGECGGLIANGEALPVVGILELVDEGDRKIFERNTTVALGVGDQVVFAKPEFARTLAKLKESSGAEIGPINAALVQIPKHLDVSVDKWGSIP